MRTQLTRLAVVISATASVSTAAFAIDPHNIRVSDGVMFTPTLQIEERHDDNIFGTDKKRQSSWVTVIEPTFKLSLDRAKSAHELKYRISSKSIHSSSSNSYIDHHITANSGFEFDVRNRLLLNAGYHKVQATVTDVGYRPDPKNDKWNVKNIGGVYTFGAREAITQVDLGLDYNELRYDNSQHNAENGERVHKGSEHDSVAARLTGYYAITPRTKLLLEGRYTDYDYKSNNDRDSKNKALLAGVTWSATAKTTGTVKVGREKKDYKNSSTLYKNNSTAMWEAGIQWAPVSYSTFDLRTRRGFEEGNTYTELDDLDQIDSVTSNVKVVDSSLAWKHYWMERLYSGAEYRRIDRKYQGAKINDDKIDQYALGLNYEAYRWLDVGVNFKHRDNDSDVAVRNYKRNIYALTFSASL